MCLADKARMALESIASPDLAFLSPGSVLSWLFLPACVRACRKAALPGTRTDGMAVSSVLMTAARTWVPSASRMMMAKAKRMLSVPAPMLVGPSRDRRLRGRSQSPRAGRQVHWSQVVDVDGCEERSSSKQYVRLLRYPLDGATLVKDLETVSSRTWDNYGLSLSLISNIAQSAIALFPYDYELRAKIYSFFKWGRFHFPPLFPLFPAHS